MNGVADVALIISLSCSGGVALAGAVSPMTAGKAAVSFPIDLSVIRDEAGVTAASPKLIGSVEVGLAVNNGPSAPRVASPKEKLDPERDVADLDCRVPVRDCT